MTLLFSSNFNCWTPSKDVPLLVLQNYIGRHHHNGYDESKHPSRKQYDCVSKLHFSIVWSIVDLVVGLNNKNRTCSGYAYIFRRWKDYSWGPFSWLFCLIRWAQVEDELKFSVGTKNLGSSFTQQWLRDIFNLSSSFHGQLLRSNWEYQLWTYFDPSQKNWMTVVKCCPICIIKQHEHFGNELSFIFSHSISIMDNYIHQMLHHQIILNSMHHFRIEQFKCIQGTVSCPIINISEYEDVTIPHVLMTHFKSKMYCPIGSQERGQSSGVLI